MQCSDMDIRIEVLRYNGHWVITQSGPGLLVFDAQTTAAAAGIEAAEKYHNETGGRATVHLWSDGNETLVFDSAGVSVSGEAARH
jgi:hypothetical protein